MEEENDGEQGEDVFYSAVKVPDAAKTPVRPLPGKLDIQFVHLATLCATKLHRIEE